MNQQESIDGLLAQAGNNARAAKSMFQTGHYDWCLFIWHLVLEHALKALILKQNKMPSYIHDLTKLAKEAELELSEAKQEALVTITKFNMNTRYDDEKRRFYKMVTKEYASTWKSICEENYLWILKQL